MYAFFISYIMILLWGFSSFCLWSNLRNKPKDIQRVEDGWRTAWLTSEDWGKRLQGIKRTFQSARLHCRRQQVEHTVLRHEGRNEDWNDARIDCCKRFTHLLFYLSVSSDFYESTGGVESPRPAGVHMCEVVVVKDPHKVSALHLQQGQKKKTTTKTQDELWKSK